MCKIDDDDVLKRLQDSNYKGEDALNIRELVAAPTGRAHAGMLTEYGSITTAK